MPGVRQLYQKDSERLVLVVGLGEGVDHCHEHCELVLRELSFLSFSVSMKNNNVFLDRLTVRYGGGFFFLVRFSEKVVNAYAEIVGELLECR